MKPTRGELGREGEEFTCGYLVEKGYRILDRNFRKPWGELDIIGVSPDKTLVFVEVKTMWDAGPLGLKPEDQVSAAKRRKFARAAELYANAHPELVSDERGWRLDVVALVKRGPNFDVRHYENI